MSLSETYRGLQAQHVRVLENAVRVTNMHYRFHYGDLVSRCTATHVSSGSLSAEVRVAILLARTSRVPRL